MGRAETRAAASLWWLAALAVAVLTVAVIGVVLGIQSLLISTDAMARAIRCCGTIFSSCLLSPSLLRATLPWIGMMILGYGILRATVNLVRSLRLNRVFAAELATRRTEPCAQLAAAAQRLGLDDQLVQVEMSGRRAFVAGLWRPRIYVSGMLCFSLDAAELDAVLLHEDHHRRSRDPLRALVIGALQDLLFFLPIGRVLQHTFLEEREHAADEAVEQRGGDRLDLASALCRLARLGMERQREPVLLAMLSGKGNVQDRVERLLGMTTVQPRTAPVRSWLTSAALLLLLFGSLYLPILMTSSPFVFQGCTPDVCRPMGCGPR